MIRMAALGRQWRRRKTGNSFRKVWNEAPRIAAAAAILAGAGLCLWLNWPGHFSWDSVVQLAEGRSGVYSGQHPPVMSWLLGLADALRPGAALFVALDVALVFGALVALALLARPASWLAAPLAAALCAAPQLIVYPAIVWKDVLFAGASVAGFAALAWAAAGWARPARRYPPLAAGLALLVLAALARQNGAVVLPFAALAVAWTAAWSGGVRRGAAWGLGTLGVSAVLVLAVSAALATRLADPAATGRAWRNLEAYDLVGAVVRDPDLAFPVLEARAPWLDTLLRDDAAGDYTASRADSISDELDQLDAHPDAAGLVEAQWGDLVLRHPLLYLRVRASAFRWVFLTPVPSECVMAETGVDGPPDALAAAGLKERATPADNAIGDYAEAFEASPVYSHATYAVVAVAIMTLLLLRRRPADIAVAAMLASALAFAASFALISIACDYRYLYDLDLSAIAGALYLAASARGAWRRLIAQQRQRQAGGGAGGEQLAAEAE